MGRPIDCLYVGVLKDYGEPRLDFSHEFVNLETGLCEHPRLHTRVFYPDLVALRFGPDGMRERFADLVKRDPPALLVHHAFREALDIDLEAMGDLTQRGVPTVEFDADSSHRFDAWIRPRLSRYALFVTTHRGSLARYEAAGAPVHLSQWAVSSWYRGYPPDRARPTAVSFVGRPHGDRRAVIGGLRRRGVRVDCWGPGWGVRRGIPNRLLGRGRNHGYVSFLGVREAMGGSVVSLNLSNASAVAAGTQIKGRHFEIPALGACQVTTPTDDLEHFYEPGREVVVAQAGEPLRDVVRACLADREKTKRIAVAGYRRTWAEHTWRRRIDGILDAVGLA